VDGAADGISNDAPGSGIRTTAIETKAPTGLEVTLALEAANFLVVDDHA
jgi:hypothetical protein